MFRSGNDWCRPGAVVARLFAPNIEGEIERSRYISPSTTILRLTLATTYPECVLCGACLSRGHALNQNSSMSNACRTAKSRLCPDIRYCAGVAKVPRSPSVMPLLGVVAHHDTHIDIGYPAIIGQQILHKVLLSGFGQFIALELEPIKKCRVG